MLSHSRIPRRKFSGGRRAFGTLAAIATVLSLHGVPVAQAATTDQATAVASPGPYLVDTPITFTSTTPCTTACRLTWKFLNGTRLGDQLGEGVSVQTSFPTRGVKTVELRLTELCVGTSRLVCDSVAYVSVVVGDAPRVADTTAPTITASGLAVEATGPRTAVDYAFAATDPDDPVVGQSCSPAPGESFPVGSTPIDCTAVDSNGNVGKASFNVVVNDTAAPTLTVPGTITVDATGPEGAVVMYTATATDLVDGPVTPICSMPAGATFPLGTTTLTCTATDAHHNASGASFQVNVVDAAPPPPPPPGPAPPVVNRTPPTLSLPTLLVANATSSRGAIVSYAVTATDSDGKPVTAACSKPSRTMFPIGKTVVSCTATDARGNTASAQVFAVHVKGAREQLADVVRQVRQWKLRSHALRARVGQVARALPGSATGSARACRLLGDLGQKLRGPLGKQLTTAQRGTLRGELARIANVVGCTR